MFETIGDRIWSADSGASGPSVCISFGVHGNERAPIDAGLRLARELEAGELVPVAGSLLLFHGNPRATAEDRRWSDGGIDLNRCFHPDVLGRAPQLYEEGRARELVAAMEARRVEVLVDFHCTVEPGSRFLMQHPPVSHAPSRRAWELLQAEVLLSDPALRFGGVSLDEWSSTRGGVGICYETGWMGDPENRPEVVHAEMRNLLRGLGIVEGEAERYPEKRLLELSRALVCEEPGFAWREDVGRNLQELPAGAVLGAYAGGREVVLEQEATLIFPKRRPELLVVGKPMVFLGTRKDG